MNQIMPVGRGVLLACDRALRRDEQERLRMTWDDAFPEIPMFCISECQIVLRDGGAILFQFTGDVSKTVISEFQRWWEDQEPTAGKDV